MPKKLFLVNLSEAERDQLLELNRKGTLSARKMKRAQILLQADQGFTDPQFMAALHVSRPCVERLRKRFVAGEMERALNEDPRPGQKRKLDGRAESTLIATACTTAPKGMTTGPCAYWRANWWTWGRWKIFRMKPCAAG